jgi:plasmid stabilization system protein ParE
MVKRRVIWSDNAKLELKETLDFYKNRNKSATYSRKLYKRFKLELEIVAKRPNIGIRTNRENTRGLIIADYIIFYEIKESVIGVLELWDTNQHPDKAQNKKPEQW